MAKIILIVDDVRINRQILRKILSANYGIIEAEDGQEAMTIMMNRHQKIAAVLLDLVMPVMDGYAVLQKMQENPALSQIPVIVTTGSTELTAEKRALTLGANDFVTKPFDPDILRRRLENLIKLKETSVMMNTLQKDRLTGVWNRETFFQKAAWEIKRYPEGHFVLSSLDIDNFKVINDQLGSETGDLVLKSLAKMVLSDCDDNGGICGRISADNFAVLYPAAKLDTSTAAQREREISMIKDLDMPVTLSMGRYFVSDKTISVSGMFDRANIARNTVKGRYDKHIALYDSSMRERLVRDQQIVTEMRAALVTGQFEAWYQPQYNHATGALIGAEALARWRHPTWGMVSPGEFVPVFERNGFVYELDKCIWEQVCAHLRAWIDRGQSPIPVSVNISRYDLFRDDLTEVVIALIRKYAIPAELLRLEITESAFAHSTTRVVDVVRDFIEHGFTVEIDDFGSGYSSLNTLKDVPAQIIKLDMRFLESSDNLDRGGNIIESIVRMSKWLGMSVIAEGVEKVSQADYLKSIGCNYIQGYLYARPMPPEQYEELMLGANREERLIALQTVENLDNNAFWNPESMDTLIFNSYVGAACIFEYRAGHIELVRSTEKFAAMLGGAGVTVGDTLRIDWNAHLDPESAEKIRAVIRRSTQDRDEITDEFLFLRLPGCPEKSYIRATIRVIAVSGDRSLAYCVIENTTARRAAEQKEREVAAQLHAIMENMSGGISAATLVDGKIGYLFVNDNYYSMFGFTREQFEREHPDGLTDLIDPRDMPSVYAAADLTAKTGESAQFEFRARKRDGTLIHVRSGSSVCAISGVNAPVHLAVLTDITSEKAAERRIRETSGRLQAIMDNMNGGISAVTMTGDGKIRYVFTNDQYYAMYGYSKAEFERELANPFDVVYPADLVRVRAKIAALLSTQTATAYRYRCRKRDGSIFVIQVYSSIVRLEGIDSPVILAVSTDVTEMATAEQKILVADEQLRFLNDLSRDLLAQPEIEGSIKDVLQKILQHFGADRAYVIEQDERGGLSTNTYEVCAPGVKGERDARRRVPDAAFTSWLTAFQKGQYVSIPDVSSLPSSRAAERKQLIAHGIKSLIAVPFQRDGKLMGFIVLDGPTRRQDQAEQLRALGDYLAVMLTRRDLTRKIEADQRAIAEFMNDTPGGFSRMLVREDGSLSTVYINEPFCRLRGMSSQEILDADRENSMIAIHPDDVRHSQELIREMLKTGEKRDTIYRLRRADGSYVPVKAYGRVTKNEAGETFLNLYYADLNEQERQRLSMLEIMPIILSAIMKSSTDMAFAKDRNFNYLCCSPGFVKFTRQKDEKDVVGRNDYDFWTRAEADHFRADDEKLFRSGESMINYVEEIPSDDGIQHYCVTSKYILRDSAGEIVGLYGNARDITDTRNTSEQLKLLSDNIPVGLVKYELSQKGILTLYESKGLYLLSGYSREAYEAMTRSNPLALVRDEDQPILRRQIELVKGGADRASCVFRITGKDGANRWLSLMGSVSERRETSVLLNCVLLDVTAQSEAERKERATAEQMSAIMENIDGGISAAAIEKNGAFSLIFANERYYAMHGYTREQFEAEVGDIFNLEVPEENQRARKIVREIIKTRKGTAFEYRCIKRNGEIAYMRCYSVIRKITGVSDNVLLSVITDITSAVLEARSKRLMEERIQAIMDNMNGGISAVTVESGKVSIVFANDQYFEMLGYTREQFNKELKNGMLDAVHPLDRSKLMDAVADTEATGKASTIEFRAFRRDGGTIWIRSKGSMCLISGIDKPVHIAATFDITAQKAADEALRVSEAEYRLAVEQGGRFIYRYNHRDNSVDLTENVASMFGMPVHLENVPESLVANGAVAKESLREYRKFFRAMKRGDRIGRMTVLRRIADGNWRWFSGFFGSVFDSTGAPVSAIVVFFDVTEEREKEVVYKRWQQSMSERRQEDYTLFRWNISQNNGIDFRAGKLLDFESPPGTPIIKRVGDYAAKRVHPDDRKRYIEFVDADAMLAAYHRGVRTKSMEFREISENEPSRWLRLTCELAEYPSSTDVEAYMLFENVDREKRREIHAKELMELDPLTGVLNRLTFAAMADEKCAAVAPGATHALIMLDIDGFKSINDTFGHAAGDQALIDMAGALRAMLRAGDLLGRLGGDEFVVFLENVSGEGAIEKKAAQICTKLRKDYSPQVQTSVSMGIAVCPRDGRNFDALYSNADLALYSVKGSGKDGFQFYRPDLDAVAIRESALEASQPPLPVRTASFKRRMLIVDDNTMDLELLCAMFKDEYTIDRARDGGSALIRMRHYGSALSVVLLDLYMQDMDGFEVLEKMRESEQTRSIPVIVVSGDSGRETGLRVIRSGAADFVTKPVDPDIIRVRVKSAVSKAENERLRAQNSLLSMQNDEVRMYKAVVENTCAVIIQYDWKSGVFTYDPAISNRIAGNFDGRKLWRILLSDFVADVADVQKMQNLVHDVANNRERPSGSVTAMLKTPSGAKHRFRMNVNKLTDEFRLTQKLILTFIDLVGESNRA